MLNRNPCSNPYSLVVLIATFSLYRKIIRRRLWLPLYHFGICPGDFEEDGPIGHRTHGHGCSAVPTSGPLSGVLQRVLMGGSIRATLRVVVGGTIQGTGVV